MFNRAIRRRYSAMSVDELTDAIRTGKLPEGAKRRRRPGRRMFDGAFAMMQARQMAKDAVKAESVDREAA